MHMEMGVYCIYNPVLFSLTQEVINFVCLNSFDRVVVSSKECYLTHLFKILESIIVFANIK
jgi:hypothetical protein